MPRVQAMFPATEVWSQKPWPGDTIGQTSPEPAVLSSIAPEIDTLEDIHWNVFEVSATRAYPST